ncbi:MAG: thiamine pyrophosphate-dependent enzyme [Thermoplasmata archaeon]|nr:thiamine pyrophosphate-dependent enzyme [Thermoplasmata archaeon]
MAEARPAPEETPTLPTDDPPLSDVLSAYRTMVVARVMDERCLTLQRQGRIGFYVPMQGQEAAQVACGWALNDEDWIFPAYREMGIALTRGVPVQLLINQFYGNSGDETKGRQMPNHYGFRRFRFVTASSPVGTQISHAVGAAMAARAHKDPIVTVSFFGDGTTSSNDFHAGLNFAGVFQAPTIFFCQNNQWAISLPREKQTRSATLAEKALAYGFPGVVVDGMDFRAVYRAVAEARARAISGGGPTLIEAQVYRLGPHSTSDDPRRYRSDAELAEWKEKDPVARLKHELRASEALTEENDQAIWDAAKQEVARAVEAAEKLPPVDPLTLFDDVYATRTPALERQRGELARELAAGGSTP